MKQKPDPKKERKKSEWNKWQREVEKRMDRDITLWFRFGRKKVDEEADQLDFLTEGFGIEIQ